MSLSRWLTTFGLALGLAAATPTAEATVLATLTVDQMTDASDLVVRGTVTEVWSAKDDNGYIWTHAQVEIDDTWKGEELGAVVVSQPGGYLGSEFSIVRSVARFSVGEETVMFLEHTGDLLQPVGMMQGKFTVRMDPDASLEMLVRYAPAPELAFDHRFIPHPDAADRVHVADFREVVDTRIELGWDGQPIPGADPAKLRVINHLQPGVK